MREISSTSVDEHGSSSVLDGTDFDELRRRLTRAVRHSCPHWLASQQEDIVQNVMLRVVQLARERGPEARFSSGYLFKSAFSATMDLIRQVQRRREQSLEATVATGRPDRNPTDPERQRISDELGEAILECLGRLARDRRIAVAMYLMGHSIPEQSRLLAWNKKRLNNLVYRGLADLRQCLTAKGACP